MPPFAAVCRRRLCRYSSRTLQLRAPSTGRCLTTRTGRPLTVLALESSADDSCCSIITSSRQILANVVIKQHLLNAQYGGIHPLRAQEAHAAGVPLAIAQALSEARMKLEDVDAIAYTRGPGMYGCLSVAAGSAKALATSAGKPVYGIHHMQAHALTPLLTELEPPEFPFLVLLVSGGHTQLVLAKGLNEFRIVANTLDNSVGDAFDKAARLLNLPASSTHNPGALLEQQASLPSLPPFDTEPLPPFPIPLSPSSSASKQHKRQHGGPVFSFAGLLTHTGRVVESLRKEGVREEAIWREVGRRFQVAAVGHLVQQIRGVLKTKVERVKGLVVSGGVASNLYLRHQLQAMSDALPPGRKVKLYYPPLELCTGIDNAAMIAWTAIVRIQAGARPEEYGLPIRPKWSLEDLYDDLPDR
ncbi:glycoprotease family-domain-containing protein [Dioszegia hungarica]|uniref:N(6)-L-threonylcarbamoyladenine synthase n=1 Tax=Dioszegia hungarica TaxID=4972 RepID=A0AA38H272_9TREE|nr:glycoprotease family-domain-containing protein [Dioszegia hungarica]KAI9632823.1 glycoprotease family-domain-containing protein [Dioszegia hungarica]